MANEIVNNNLVLTILVVAALAVGILFEKYGKEQIMKMLKLTEQWQIIVMYVVLFVAIAIPAYFLIAGVTWRWFVGSDEIQVKISGEEPEQGFVEEEMPLGGDNDKLNYGGYLGESDNQKLNYGGYLGEIPIIPTSTSKVIPTP